MIERVEVDLVGDPATCEPHCADWLPTWYEFWQRWAAEPVALMTCDGYYAGLRSKSRSMARQAQRRFAFREFLHDERRAEIEAINFSKTETSFGPMHGWYTQPVQSLGPQRFCEKHGDAWYGGFDADDVLRGYARLIRLNEIAIVHDIFAHADNATGVQNGLLAYMADAAGVEHISYHTMDAGGPGRQSFKERTGFRAVELHVA